MAGHGSDDQLVVRGGDRAKLGDPAQVDEAVGARDPHVQHRHQRLAAGQDQRVVTLVADEGDRLGEGLRGLEGERGRSHGSGTSSPVAQSAGLKTEPARRAARA